MILLYDNCYMNLNSENNNDENTAYTRACELSNLSLSHEEMMGLLKNGNIPEKQFAALTLDCINSIDEGKILIGNLTGCDGKIRESVALKINNLLAENKNMANYLNFPEIFALASIDINSNICRLVIDSVDIMKDLPDFKEKYLNIILKYIEETFRALDKFIYRDKKYVINKQLFKLYWCLESLKLFVKDIEKNKLFEILARAAEEKEYTIREKVAQILNLINDRIFFDLKEKLRKDENYYVREALGNSNFADL